MSPQVKLGELRAGNGGRSSGMIAGSAGSSVLRMGWLGDAELTSRLATCSGGSGRSGGSLAVLGVVGTTFTAIETGSGAGKKLLTRFTP